MKKFGTLLIAFMLVIICVFLLPTEVQAATSGTCGDNLTWTLDDKGTLTISGIGEMELYSSKDDDYWGSGLSPWSYDNKVKKIIIEDGVTTIGGYAFYKCYSLTSITIPDSVTTIGGSAFYNCTSLTSVTIPDSVTTIGREAFYNCTSLTSVTIPDSVTTIGVGAFHGCSSLTSITIPDSVTTIDDSVFGHCAGLTNITIPDSVTTIGKYAFYGCSSLTSITIPDSVTTIDDGVFTHCAGLTRVTIPDSVTTIGNEAFQYCTGLTSVTIPDSVTTIGSFAFSDCTSLTSATIPDSVTTIGDYAFSGCSSLTNVTIPDSVTFISMHAFSGCTSLTSVTIGDSVTTIGDYAFSNCFSLTEIVLPKGMDTIESYAFYECSKLSTVYYKGTQADWDWIVFERRNDYLINANIFHEYTGCKHTWNEGTVTKPATCKEAGSKTATCTTCNATQIVVIPQLTTHSYSGWAKIDDNSHNRVCAVCQKEETVAHKWDAGKITTKASCKQDGVKTYTCADCNATRTEVIPKGEHTWDSKVTKEATCKEEGVKTYTCSTCQTTKTETIAKSTKHTYKNDCDTDCNVCGATRTITHKYKTSWSKDKTGHWHECSVCGDKKDFAEHKPGAAATEEKAQTCTVCKYVITPQLSHTHKYSDDWEMDESNHWHACSGCEEKGSYEAHIFDNACDTDCNACSFTRTTEHTYKTEWSKDASGHWHECSECGAKTDEATHIPGAEATETTAQTCTECGYELAPIVVKPEPEDNGGSTTIIIVACVVGVAAIGGGAALFFIKKKH